MLLSLLKVCGALLAVAMRTLLKEHILHKLVVLAGPAIHLLVKLFLLLKLLPDVHDPLGLRIICFAIDRFAIRLDLILDVGVGIFVQHRVILVIITRLLKARSL